ncbi:MAG: pilus assembly protein PilM [Chloroflexi bacterium]|nr:pilus assembly protein PilM [Chloroflexota bacterium]
MLRGDRVEKWGRVTLTPDLVKNDVILQSEAVGEAVQRLLKQLEAPKGKVIVSLSGLRSVHRFFTLPLMEPDLVEEAVQRAMKGEIPVPLEQLYLSWRPLGSKNGEQEFFLMGVPRDLVDAEVQALTKGGVRPDIMWLKPLALTRLVSLQDALIVDLEPGSYNIILLANGVPAIMRTTIPRGDGATLEDNIRRLTEEILRTIEFYNQGHPESPFNTAAPAFLTGELSGDATVTELVKDGIDHPVLPLEPPVKCPPDMPVASYAVNIGLALAKVPIVLHGERPRDVSLNILPDRYRGRGWSLKLIFFSLAATVAMIGLLPTYQLKIRNDAETTRLTGELAAVTQELRQVRLAMNKESALKDDVAKAEAAVKTLEAEHQAILARRGEFTNALGVVTGLLPAGVRLRSIVLSSGQITLEGEMNSPADAVSYAKAFEKEGSFPRVSITMVSETAFSITVSR